MTRMDLRDLWRSVSAARDVRPPLAFCCALLMTTVVESQIRSQERMQNANGSRLMGDLFRNYNRDVRPVFNDSEPVNVSMHLWFKQVLKVDEIDQILTIYSWVEQYWMDEFLRWDPAEYGGIETIYPPAHKVWKPDITVYNNADMNTDDNELSTNVVLKYTGYIINFRAAINKIACTLDMTYFPFDVQTCHMQFSSWSLDGGKLKLQQRKDNRTNNTEYYVENVEWKLLYFNYSHNERFYDCCVHPYHDVTYTFHLERNPSYYILNLIIPSVFITVVTMIGFFTPYSSTGENTEKVSLGVTALLSLAITLLMVADKMPATSKVVPLIGKYYIGLIGMIFTATIASTLTLKLQRTGNAGVPMSRWWRVVVFDWLARLFLMRNAEMARLSRLGERPDQRQQPTSNKRETRAVNGRLLLGGRCDLDELAALNAVESPPAAKPRHCVHFSNSQVETDMVDVDLCTSLGSENDEVWHRRLSATAIGSAPARGAVVAAPSPRTNVDASATTPFDADDGLAGLRVLLEEIRGRLERDESVESVKRQYEQATRVVEKLLMALFVSLAAFFAAYVLNAPMLDFAR